MGRPRHCSGGYSIPLLFSERSVARSLYRDESVKSRSKIDEKKIMDRISKFRPDHDVHGYSGALQFSERSVERSRRSCKKSSEKFEDTQTN